MGSFDSWSFNFVSKGAKELAIFQLNGFYLFIFYRYNKTFESSNSVKYTMNVQTHKLKITNSSYMSNTKCAENKHKL